MPGSKAEAGIARRVDHLGLEPGSAGLALVTGDPNRAAVIAQLLGAQHVSDRRGLACYVAGGDPPLAIVGSGIGGPAMAIVAEELAMLGIRAIVRLGTCGALQPGVRPGHLVVSSACVRDDGTSRAYVDQAFPAAAEPRLTALLAEQAGVTGSPVHLGITHCKDAYYLEKAGMVADSERARARWQALRSAGVLATEMEAAALFVVASLRGIAAGAILIAVGKEPTPGYDQALRHAVAAAAAALSAYVRSGALDALRPRLCDTSESLLRQDRLGPGEEAGRAD